MIGDLFKDQLHLLWIFLTFLYKQNNILIMACELDLDASNGLVLVNASSSPTDGNQYPINSTILLDCNEGYYGNNWDQSQISLTCLEGGNWSGMIPTCLQYTTTDNPTTESNTSSSNIRVYVAVGILLCVLVFGLVLLVDFIYHIRRKLRIRRNSQRKVTHDTQRPSSFICRKGIITYDYPPPIVPEAEQQTFSRKLSAQDLKKSQRHKPHKLPPLDVDQSTDSNNFSYDHPGKYGRKQHLVEVEQQHQASDMENKQDLLISSGKPADIPTRPGRISRRERPTPHLNDQEMYGTMPTSSRSNLIGTDVEDTMTTEHNDSLIGAEVQVTKRPKKRSKKKIYSTQEWHVTPRGDVMD